MLVMMKTTPISVEKSGDSRITATLIAQLKKQIASGSISPGDKFPPERELAKTFRVNRASMRQALKVLEMMGVLTQRVGDGTYLSNSAETLLSEPLDFLVLVDGLSAQQLMETRRIVEPEMAARAAERSTSDDLAALRAAMTILEKSKTQRERISAELEFHDTVLKAAGNRILRLLFRDVYRILLTNAFPQSKTLDLDRSLSFHRRIYAAIKSHDAEGARAAMREHLSNSSKSVEVEVVGD
jgi:GntR family transcriptional repressor for pyruvate dehydrogenase complex